MLEVSDCSTLTNTHYFVVLKTKVENHTCRDLTWYDMQSVSSDLTTPWPPQSIYLCSASQISIPK